MFSKEVDRANLSKGVIGQSSDWTTLKRDGAKLWEKRAEGIGFKGHTESLWDKVIIWCDKIIDQRGPSLAYDILTGKPVKRKHPVTGAEIPWEFTKIGHHCNYAIASEHLLTFRAANAEYHDLATGGTMALPGFRSGCRTPPTAS